MLASCNKDEHQHSYTSSVTTPATCSNPGVETFTCSCGLTYTQIIPATGDHSWEKVKEYPASCESEGWTVYECSVCHEQKQDDWTPKLDHKYEAVETVEATCTEDGYQIMQCSYCKSRYTDAQYSAEHKATGHKWIVNTDAEDAASDEDKKLGFVTVKEADCLNAAQLERKCSVCGHTEDKEGAPALGHLWNDEVVTSKTANLCKVNNTLIDAEGNKFYAFECEREDCPVNVVVDARGTEKHYIKAVDHKMKTIEEHINCVDTADNKSWIKEICENCDTWSEASPKKTDVDPVGHSYNTLQSDGKTAVVVCIEDKGINTLAKYLDFMKATVGAATFYKNQTAYSTAWTNAKNDPDNTTAVGADGTFAISRVCTRCGTPTAATGHDYVIAKYVDGSFTELEKDEEGALVDYSDTVTVVSMNCRYVQICTGCGDVAKRGAHQNVSTATCRSGGICPDCGRQVTAQLSHIYANISDFVGANGLVSGAEKEFGSTKISHKDAYDAWKKLSATETWMVPVNGDCDSKSTDVTVCVQCLIDAAKGTEVVWNQATEKPASGNIPTSEVSSTNAYVITSEFSHDYQPTYFALDAADTTAANMPYADTSCQVGFKVAYICTKCGDVFTNVAVGDDPDTKDVNEAKDNKPAAAKSGLPEVYTDANGFVLDVTEEALKAVADKDHANMDMTDIRVDELAKLQAEDNQGQHLLYVVEGYNKTSGYVAPTCVAVGQVPYTCLHCGTIVVLSAGADDADNEKDVNDVKNTFDYATQNEVDAVLGADAKVKIIAPEAVQGDKNDITDFEKINPRNHAGKVYACGEHCDHKNVLGAADCGNNKANKTDHSAVTVTYELKSTLKSYYSNYTIKVAQVGTTPKDPSIVGKDDINNYIVSMLDGTKVAACGENKYKAPSLAAYNSGANGAVVADSYLVLVDEAGKAYQFVDANKGIAFYTEDGSGEAGKISDLQNVTVNSNDIFFMSFPTTGAGVKLPVAAPVTASDEPSLKLALNNNAPDPVTENGKQINVLTVELAGNIDVTSIPQPDRSATDQATINRVVYDLNGHKLTTTQQTSFSATDDVVFQNGSIEFSKVMLNDNDTPGTSSDDYEDKAGASMALGEVGKLTLDNVTFTAAGSGLFVATNAYADPDTGETDNYLTIKDSTLVIKGYFGVGTNATDSSAIVGSPKVTIEDSTITMNPDDTFGVGGMGNNKDNTALFINVPSNVTVTGSTLTANRQAVIVRGGTLQMSDTTLNLVEGFTSQNEQNYINGEWSTGNEVPQAVMTIGHDGDESAYQYKTTVTLSDVVFNAYTGATKVFVASDFANDTLVNQDDTVFAKNENGEPIKNFANITTMPIMVYLNANNLLSGSDIDFVTDWDDGTIQLVNCNDVTGIY